VSEICALLAAGDRRQDAVEDPVPAAQLSFA
jgi:hypothetical protein